jgi:hypothetical protein
LDRKAAEELHKFQMPVFENPRPSFPQLQTLRDFLGSKYTNAVSLQENDIAGSSSVDELERSGVFAGMITVPSRALSGVCDRTAEYVLAPIS